MSAVKQFKYDKVVYQAWDRNLVYFEEGRPVYSHSPATFREACDELKRGRLSLLQVVGYEAVSLSNQLIHLCTEMDCRIKNKEDPYIQKELKELFQKIEENYRELERRVLDVCESA